MRDRANNTLTRQDSKTKGSGHKLHAKCHGIIQTRRIKRKEITGEVYSKKAIDKGQLELIKRHACKDSSRFQIQTSELLKGLWNV